jgi:CHAD domain-containing protein
MPTRTAVTGPVKWQAVPFAKESSASDVFCRTGGALLIQLHANQPGTLEDRDPEYLHQMRVALRRLRALLSLYAALLGKRARKAADKDLKWLAHALAPARDSDVFAHDIWPSLHDMLGGGQLVDALEAEWRRQQRLHIRVARRALNSLRYRRMVSRLQLWFSVPPSFSAAAKQQDWTQRARGLARKELDRRTQRLRRYGRAPGALDAAALHGLRIDIKKLRYAIDVLGPLFKPSPVEKVLAALSHLQNVLGAMNDGVVAMQKIDAALPKEERVDIAQLRAQIATWHSLRSRALQRKLDVAWRAYRRAKSFW